MKKFLSWLIINALSVVSVLAQISGRIIDEGDQPLSFVNVQLLSLPDSTFIIGTISDKNGAFHLSASDFKEKIVVLTFVGYETKFIVPTSNDLNVIKMTPSSVVINTVVVTGRKPMYQLKGDRLIASIGNSSLKTLGDAKDILKQMPGIRSERDKIEVFGKGTPLIYINGRMVRDDLELKQLKSQDIDKIELITNPGAEYDATVSSVIRIKTRSLQGEGLGGSINSGIMKAKFFSFEEGVKLNYRHKNLDLFTSVNYENTKELDDETDDMTIFSDPIWKFNAKLKSNRHDENIDSKVGANYRCNGDNFIGAIYEYSQLPQSPVRNIEATYETFANNILDDEVTSRDWQKNTGSFHRVNSYYNGLIAKKIHIDFNFDFLYGTNDNKLRTNEESEKENSRIVTSLGNTKNVLYSGKLILGYSIGKGTLQFGGEYTNIRRNDLYQNNESIIDDAAIKTNEQKHAEFLAFNMPFKEVSFNVGIRFEHADFKYWDAGIYKEDKSRIYTQLFPNVSVSFPMKDARMSIAYSSKTQRPSFSQLDGNVQYLNRFMYKSGNPLLKPQTMHDVTWQMLYKFTRFSVGYVYIRDYIGRTRESYKNDEIITLGTYQNFKKNQQINIAISLSPKIKFWHPSLNVYFSQPLFEAMYKGQMKKMQNPRLFLSLNNQLNLSANLILSVDMDYQSAGSQDVVQWQPSGGIDLGIRHSFFSKKMDINLKVKDLFNTRKLDFTGYSQTTSLKTRIRYSSRCVLLTAVYYFNAVQSKYKGGNSVNEDIRRLK